MQHAPQRLRRFQRRGNVVVFVAIALVVLLGFVAFAVDIGFVYNMRAEMQRTADASALAGASGIDEGESEVYSRAHGLALGNAVNHAGVSMDEAEVTIGNWEGLTRTFVETPITAVPMPNAVRVVGHREQIPLFFGAVLGSPTTDVEKGAIAVSGGGICVGIWGLEGITGDGNILTDSYRSDEGTYGGGPVYGRGDLCSCRDIYLNGSVNIHGNTMHGVGYDLYIEGSSYDIWGVPGEHQCGPYVPPFSMDDARAENDNETIGLTDRGQVPWVGGEVPSGDGPWDLYVTGNNNLTLTGGTYYFDSVLVDGSASVIVAGPTTMYIAGDAIFTGDGLVNVSMDPHDLIIYCTGTTMTLTGTAGIAAGIVAPNTDLILPGTGDFFGAIVARTIDMDGTTNIHVDETLAQSLFDSDPLVPALVQ